MNKYLRSYSKNKRGSKKEIWVPDVYPFFLSEKMVIPRKILTVALPSLVMMYAAGRTYDLENYPFNEGALAALRDRPKTSIGLAFGSVAFFNIASNLFIDKVIVPEYHRQSEDQD